MVVGGAAAVVVTSGPELRITQAWFWSSCEDTSIVDVALLDEPPAAT